MVSFDFLFTFFRQKKQYFSLLLVNIAYYPRYKVKIDTKEKEEKYDE